MALIEFSKAQNPNRWDVESPDFDGRVEIKVICDWRLPPKTIPEEAMRAGLKVKLNKIARSYETEIAQKIAAEANNQE